MTEKSLSSRRFSDPDDVDFQVIRGVESFQGFYRREIRKVTALAYAFTGSAAAAEDIAQESMLAAYRRWDEVGRLENPGAWVRRVIANQSVSAVRRRLVEARGLHRLALQGRDLVEPDLPSDSEWVWVQVRRLPRRQAQAVTLYYLEHLTMPEIAEILGCSAETVSTHLRRGRATLEKYLSKGERT